MGGEMNSLVDYPRTHCPLSPVADSGDSVDFSTLSLSPFAQNQWTPVRNDNSMHHSHTQRTDHVCDSFLANEVSNYGGTANIAANENNIGLAVPTKGSVI